MEAEVESEVNSSVQPGVQQDQLVAWIASDYVRPKRREIREATILAVQEDRVLVDLGAKRDGRVPGADLGRLDDDAESR